MTVQPTISGISSPAELQQALIGAQYLANDGLATAAYLALALGKPLLLEGRPRGGQNRGRQGHRGGAVAQRDPVAVL